MIVELDGQFFNDDVADSNGAYWYVTGLTGWDSPDLRQDGTEPTSRHGSVLSKALLAARAMVLTGVVKSPDLATHYASVNSLNRASNNIYATVPMRVTEDVVREVGVYRAGAMRMTLLGSCAFQFDLPLTAPDPLKYATVAVSTTIAAGATKTITNDGSFVTENVTITANAEGNVELVNDAAGTRGLRTDMEVFTGTSFNVLKRTVKTASGRNVYSALAPSSVWWGLQPGANVIHNVGPTGVTILHYPAWL